MHYGRPGLRPRVSLSVSLSVKLTPPFRQTCARARRSRAMLVSILSQGPPHTARRVCPDASCPRRPGVCVAYAGEARRGGVLWEGPEPDAAFAPDEVCVRGEREHTMERAPWREHTMERASARERALEGALESERARARARARHREPLPGTITWHAHACVERA